MAILIMKNGVAITTGNLQLIWYNMQKLQAALTSVFNNNGLYPGLSAELSPAGPTLEHPGPKPHCESLQSADIHMPQA